jgi:hypothetical protein
VSNVLVWGNITPNQNPSWAQVSPGQNPNWTQIAA